MPELPIEESERNPESVRCPIASDCGGCARITEPYSAQLSWKTERVRSALTRFGALAAVAVEPCLPAPEPWRYRNRAKLAVADVDGAIRIGLYQRGSNRIVDLAPCVVQRPVLQRAIEDVRRWLTAHRLAAPTGPVFYVDLREMSGERFHATFVVAERDERAKTIPYDALIAASPQLGGVAMNFGNPVSSYPMGETTRVVSGAETFDAPVPTVRAETVSFAVPVSGFFQVATSLLPDVHHRMRDHLGADGVLFDLYCGVGVHGLMIERGRVDAWPGIVGIDESASACSAARMNAEHFGIPARYLAGKVEQSMEEALAERQATRFVLNPGRSGCRPSVLERLRAMRGARIAYLSCNPDTLARDLDTLVRDGELRVRRVTPLDLMPQTDHVEALALLD